MNEPADFLTLHNLPKRYTVKPPTGSRQERAAVSSATTTWRCARTCLSQRATESRSCRVPHQEGEAAIVRRIFALCAGGKACAGSRNRSMMNPSASEPRGGPCAICGKQGTEYKRARRLYCEKHMALLIVQERINEATSPQPITVRRFASWSKE